MPNQTCMGYRRPLGAGVRNRLVVIPTVVCSAHVCCRIAAAIPGAVALPHQHGCSQVDFDVALTARVLAGMAFNPNVGAALVVSLGCEVLEGAPLYERIAAQGIPVAFATIQEKGGSMATISAGVEAGQALLATARKSQPQPITLSDLTIGVATGQPDASSAPLEQAIEVAVARLVAAGGTVIRPRPGGNLEYGERPPGPGLWHMVAPAQHEVEALTGLAAAGCGLILYGTGAGTPIGNPVVPVIKVTASPMAVADWGDQIDLNLQSVEGDPAAAILAALRRACAEEVAAEVLGHEEFAIHRIGLTL